MAGSGITRQFPLDHNHLIEQGRSHSFRAVVEHLFIAEKEPLYIYLILAGITGIGFILRVLDINQSIAYDEAYTFIQYASKPFKYILADYSAPNNHIFHTILMGTTYRLFGAQPWILRLPAFSAGVLMIPAMYLAARRFFSPEIGRASCRERV